MSKPDLNEVDLQMQLLSGAVDCQPVSQFAREVYTQVIGVHDIDSAKQLVRDVLATNPDWKHIDTIDGVKYWEYLP